MISDKRIVFFGTPEYVISVLGTLKSAGYKITAVVTQPPKPVGRKKILTPSPIAQWANKYGIPVFDGPPKTLIEPLKALGMPIAVLASYGRIIPQELINAFPKGILNIHPSLLPKYRGASPIEAALVAGDKQTGVTIIKLDAEMDHGPIIAQKTQDIKQEDTKLTLRERLFKIGAELIVKILPDYLEGKLGLKEQNHKNATFTTLMKKDHGFIPGKYLEAAMRGETVNEKWQIPFVKNYYLLLNPYSLDRFIRSVNPWPGAFTKLKIKNENLKILKILKTHVEELPTTNYQLQTTFVLDEVQLEGKNPVSWEQFRIGYPQIKIA